METERAPLIVEDDGIEAAALSNLGIVHSLLDETQQAVGYYDQSLTLKRQIPDRRNV